MTAEKFIIIQHIRIVRSNFKMVTDLVYVKIVHWFYFVSQSDQVKELHVTAFSRGCSV